MKFVLSPDVILCGWLGLKHRLTNELKSRSASATWPWLFPCTLVCVHRQLVRVGKLLPQPQASWCWGERQIR